MKSKYGNFADTQISSIKEDIRKSIFFLLLCVDPKTKNEYEHINIEDAFTNLLYKLDGLNSLLLYPKQLVTVMNLLEKAHLMVQEGDVIFSAYRKLILDAGSEVMKIKED